jgi:hypothetical protein
MNLHNDSRAFLALLGGKLRISADTPTSLASQTDPFSPQQTPYRVNRCPQLLCYGWSIPDGVSRWWWRLQGGQNLPTKLCGIGRWLSGTRKIREAGDPVISPPRMLLYPRGVLGAGGNPSLHHCMGPRIREDDKIVNPSFPPRALLSLASFCPRCEVFFKARGALGEGTSSPEYFFSIRGVLSA